MGKSGLFALGFASIVLCASLSGFTAEDQSSIAVLNDSAEAISATMDMIDSAKTSVDLMYYQIKEDRFAALFIQKLIEARRRNVRVRLIYDAYESKITPETIAILNEAGVETRVFHSLSQLWPGRIHTVLNKRMHDKLLIVDRVLMKLGDRNVGDTYYDLRAGARFQFISTEYLIKGATALAASKTFNTFWESKEVSAAVGSKKHQLILERSRSILELALTVPRVSHTPQFMKLKNPPVFFSDFPTRPVGPGVTAEFILNALKSAKRSIVIESPYLILTDEFRETIALAINRGVRVTMMTNGKWSVDEQAAGKAYDFGKRDLIAMGIELKERRIPARTFHQKTFVLDEEVTILTSFNMDPRSQNLSTESGVLISDPEFTRQVLQRMKSHSASTFDVLSVSTKSYKLLSGQGVIVKTTGDVCSNLVSRGKSWLLRPLL